MVRSETMKYVIILNSTNFPYYLRWDPDSPHLIEWTPIKESAYIYASENTANADIERMGLDAYVKLI